jgi:hypothetical protein
MLFHILKWVCFTTQRFDFAALRQQRHFLSTKQKTKKGMRVLTDGEKTNAL